MHLACVSLLPIAPVRYPSQTRSLEDGTRSNLGQRLSLLVAVAYNHRVASFEGYEMESEYGYVRKVRASSRSYCLHLHPAAQFRAIAGARGLHGIVFESSAYGVLGSS
jgi:hypothetical protein